MSEEERTKTLINNIKLNINEQNVYEFGLCVEQWKQILDYIDQLQQENQKYKEVIDKAIELNKQVIKDTKEFYRPTKDIIYSGDTLIDIAEQNLKILKEVE